MLQGTSCPKATLSYSSSTSIIHSTIQSNNIIQSMLCGILSVPHNIVMDMNNVMFGISFQWAINNCSVHSNDAHYDSKPAPSQALMAIEDLRKHVPTRGLP